MSFNLKAKHILLTYFDPFGGNPSNNSEVLALKVANLMQESSHKVTVCELRTVFDKAFEQLNDCLHSVEQPVDMVVSLGEAGCKKIKIETRAINFDKSRGPDNDGIERFGTKIVPDGPEQMGVTLPVHKAFCGLANNSKRNFFISHTAGSFVCNNTLYLGLHNLELPYTFIHVPKASCSSTSKNEVLAKDLVQFLSNLATEKLSQTPQPATKLEVAETLKTKLSSCEQNFYNILRREY